MNAAELVPIWFLAAELERSLACVYNRLGKSDKAQPHNRMWERPSVPLTERVEVRTALQKGGRAQAPKLVRWKHKLQSTQVLKVSVAAAGMLHRWETFYGWVDKSGRITVPRMIQNELLRTAPSP